MVKPHYVLGSSPASSAHNTPRGTVRNTGPTAAAAHSVPVPALKPEALCLDRLPIRDALSGAVVHTSDVTSPTKYSDDDDDDDVSHMSTPNGTIVRRPASQLESAGGSAAGGTAFKTLRQLRQQKMTGDVPMSPDEAERMKQRPATSPLVVEAVYGEKGTGTEKMFLVKYVSVEAEQWTSAEFVNPTCSALREWNRGKQRDRAHK